MQLDLLCISCKNKIYLRLSGNLPFNSIDVGIILQKTMEGAFPLNDKIWKSISEQAKDLVSKLL